MGATDNSQRKVDFSEMKGPDLKYYCAPLSQGPFACQSSGILSSPDGFLHAKRRLESSVLILVREGTLHILQDGRLFSVGAGEYLFLYAGLEHEGARPSTGPLLYDWTHFTPPPGGRFCSPYELPQPGESWCVMPETGWIHPSGALLRINQEARGFLRTDCAPKGGADYALTLLLLTLTREFWQSREQRGAVPPVIAQAAEWIRGHYHQPLSASSVAERFGYHVDYLSALFKQCMGMSLSQFIIRTRLDAAKDLLAEYGVSVREAALSCGFSDEKYFMRQFRKKEGMPPGEYRKLHGK